MRSGDSCGDDNDDGGHGAGDEMGVVIALVFEVVANIMMVVAIVGMVMKMRWWLKFRWRRWWWEWGWGWGGCDDDFNFFFFLQIHCLGFFLIKQ